MPLSAHATCEVWLLVDSHGDTAVADSEEAVVERYEENIGPLENSGGYRLTLISVTLPLPTRNELSVSIPDLSEDAPAVTLEAQAAGGCGNG